MSLAALFLSEENFKTAFQEGLSTMLNIDELGVYILVLANGSFDEDLFGHLEPVLKKCYEYFRERYRKQQLGQFAQDDLGVFSALLETGFDALSPTLTDFAGVWEKQFNQLRSFRPARMSAARVDSINQPFNNNGFHFNKPFLKKEQLWQGQFNGHSLRLLYNKFPFVANHALVVFDADQSKNQFLAEADFQLAWQFINQTGEHIAHAGLAYNSLGAYASVNHQHFQFYVRQIPLPIEHASWLHNGGDRCYPLTIECHDMPDTAWQAIDARQKRNQAFNLLMRPGKLYLVKRALQGSYQHAGWTEGFAWAETSGLLVTTGQQNFHDLDQSKIVQEFAKLA